MNKSLILSSVLRGLDSEAELVFGMLPLALFSIAHVRYIAVVYNRLS